MLALAMTMVGASIAAIGPIGAGIALVRMSDAQRVMVREPIKRRIATFDYAYRMLLFAVVTAAGICLLLFGGVVGFGMAAWAPALPGGLLLASALAAGYARWLLTRARASR